MKTCSKCGEEKPLDHFHARRRSPDGRKAACAKCERSYQRTRLDKNRSDLLARRHDMTADEYDAILEAQDGVCGVCGKPETLKTAGGPRRLAVDHDHHTGLVRGLLCFHCNTTLGKMGDDLAGALDFFSYLVSPPAAKVQT